MNSKKTKEIKNNLQCCAMKCRDCKQCTLINQHPFACVTDLIRQTLKYVEVLEQSNKKWQELCADEVKCNTLLKERVKELEVLCNKTYEDLTKEIDRLEEINKKLKQSNKNILFVNEKIIEENDKLKERITTLEEGIAKSMLGCEFLPECTKEKEKQVVEDFIKEIGKIQLQEYNGAELCLMLDLSQVLKKLAKKYGVKIGE